MTTRKMFAARELFYISSLLKCHWQISQRCIRVFSSQVKQQPLITEGPWQSYEEKISSGVLSRDSHQDKVVQQLQQIYQEVVSFERPSLQNQSSSLFSFLKKSQPQKIIAPKGLYIFGSVGGGKTMLMDLFYETLPVSLIQTIN